MSDTNKDENELPDPAKYGELMTNLAEKSQKIVTAFLERHSPTDTGQIDPLNVSEAFMELTRQMLNNPAKLVEAQVSLWQDYMSLWQSTAGHALGGESEPVTAPEKGLSLIHI